MATRLIEDDVGARPGGPGWKMRTGAARRPASWNLHLNQALLASAMKLSASSRDGHDLEQATPDVRAPSHSWSLLFWDICSSASRRRAVERYASGLRQSKWPGIAPGPLPSSENLDQKSIPPPPGI